MSTSVSVVKGDVKKEWPLVVFRIPSSLPPPFRSSLFMSLEELADQEFDAGDVPPNLEDRAVLLRVGKIKRVHGSRADVLLPNYPCVKDKVREK